MHTKLPEASKVMMSPVYIWSLRMIDGCDAIDDKQTHDDEVVAGGDADGVVKKRTNNNNNIHMMMITTVWWACPWLRM